MDNSSTVLYIVVLYHPAFYSYTYSPYTSEYTVSCNQYRQKVPLLARTQVDLMDMSHGTVGYYIVATQLHSRWSTLPNSSVD
jgi:tmRNA-binding protein